MSEEQQQQPQQQQQQQQPPPPPDAFHESTERIVESLEGFPMSHMSHDNTLSTMEGQHILEETELAAVAAATNNFPETIVTSSSWLLDEETATATPVQQKAHGFAEEGKEPRRTVVDCSHPTTEMRCMEQLSNQMKEHFDQAMTQSREEARKDLDRVLNVLQQEATKRTMMEQRLYSQLLLQSENMIAMELKLLRLEAKVEQRHSKQSASSSSLQRTTPIYMSSRSTSSAFQTIDELPGEEQPLHRMDVITSGASLASGVTAGTFEDKDDVDEQDSHQHSEVVMDQGVVDMSDSGEPVSREEDDDDDERREDVSNIIITDSQASTPTQGSRPQIGVGPNLDSIMLNPMIGESSVLGVSMRATRGDNGDGNSSLGTNRTNSTYTSTIVTSTTRGESSLNVRRIVVEPIQDQLDETVDPGEDAINPAEDDNSRPESPPLSAIQNPQSMRGRPAVVVESTAGATGVEDAGIRSRSQSPLTVQSSAYHPVPDSIDDDETSLGNSTLDVSSGASTVGVSLLSSAAVIPPPSRYRRPTSFSIINNSHYNTNNNNNNSISNDSLSFASSSRPLANRVVSFTTDVMVNDDPAGAGNGAGGDSITMPDELDNLSEVADAFAASARMWREEYEARLDALQKRWAAE